MRPIGYTSLMCLLAATAVGCSAGAPSSNTNEAPTASAATAERSVKGTLALSGIRDLLQKGAANRLGFSSPADIDRATLGAEMPVYFVSAADLAHYTASADPHALLGEEKERLTLVSVDGTVRSLVSFGHGEDGVWQVTGVGRASLARALDKTAAELVASRSVTGLSLVVVPELALRMVAHNEDGELMLTAVNDVDNELTNGRTLLGRNALGHLAPLAAAKVGR
jgi:hypothetical protein